MQASYSFRKYDFAELKPKIICSLIANCFINEKNAL